MAGKQTIWSLALEISGKGTEASQAIRTVKQQLEDLKAAAGQAGKDWKNFTGNATKLALGVAGGVAAATAGVVTMANSFAAAGDKAADTSAALGIGVEAYQELAYAMGQSGSSAQEFDTALQKFNLTVRQGAAGNEAMKKQLEAVGLSAHKLAMVKPEQALEEIANHLQTLPNDAKRTQVAVALFGKTAGPNMMAAMSQGSEGLRRLSQEARDLGIVLSKEQVEQAGDYKDAQQRLMESVTGMKNQFIGSAIGPLTEAFDHLKNAIVEQMPAIQELGKKFGQWLGSLVKRLPEIIDKIKEFGSWVIDTVTGIKDFVGGWENLAKILAGLAIAPTFISGLKVVWSLGKFIKIAIGAIGPLLGGLSGGFGAIAMAALPIIGIVAGIAAAAFLIVKNWDKIKPVVINAVSSIRDVIGKVIESLTAWWEKHGEGVMAAIDKIADIITSVFIVAWNILSTAIEIAGNVLGGFIGFIADCVGWLSEHKTVLGAVAIVVGTLTAALIAYNVAQAIANAGGLLAVIRMGAQAVATGALSAATGVWSTVSSIAAAATTAFGAAMTFLTSPITLVILAIGALIAAVYLIIKNWDKISEFFRGLWENIKNIFSGIGSWFSEKFTAAKDAILNIFTAIKAIIENVADVLKTVFQGPVEVVKGIIGGLTGIFTGVFDAIQSKIIEFTDFFKSKFEGIKDFFGGIGNAIGGAFGGRDAAVPGHASGGIFTQPHIAQIAEQGAEAVVPLNNSPGGFGVWKQAGELGGYLKTASEQSPAVSAAAPVATVVPAAKTPESSPVMAAASQKISSGDTTVRIDFKMTNNFNGGTPGSETTQQISEAGQKAGDDFEAKVKSVFEAMMRDRQRMSYA